jgi:hypothetical protein
MKYLVMIILITFSFINLTDAENEYNPRKLTINQFNNLTISEQNDYINSFNNESKQRFLMILFNSGEFMSPPTFFVKFLANGKILSTDSFLFTIPHNVSYWENNKNILRLWKNNNSIPFPKENELFLYSYKTKMEYDKIQKNEILIFVFYNKLNEPILYLEYVKEGTVAKQYFNKYINK